MFAWLKSLFPKPVPVGEPEELKSFAAGEQTVTNDNVIAADGGWRITVEGNDSVRLFELPVKDIDSCMLTYSAEVKTEDLSGKTYIEMWCCLPDRGEFFSKGLKDIMRGNTAWKKVSVPFYLKPGEKPDLLKLNIHVEGKGAVHVRDLKVLKTPLAWP